MSLRLGSNDPVVLAWQQVMLKRFTSYAKAADGGPLRADGYFGQDDLAVHREWQRRTHRAETFMVSDEELALLGVVQRPTGKPVLITAQGTGVDMWTGPPADTARELERRKLCTWQPLGNWPAATFPMWPSITQGVAEGEKQIRFWAGDRGQDIWLAGYSQGAIVTSLLWKYSLAPGGPLADLRHKVTKAVTWGNPMREAGRFRGDGADWDARPDTGGAMVDRLENTPSWWVDFAHKADLYTDCEMDDEGEYKRAICKIVMGNQWWAGQDNIFEQIGELFAHPFVEVWAMAKAIWDAGLFFAHGTGPHVDYNVGPAIDYLAA